MKRSICLFSVLLFIALSVPVFAQNRPAGATTDGMTPGLRRQALELNIESRVLEGQQIVWSELNNKVAMPGTPVSVQLVGSNIIVVVQFTPFTRRDGNVLVAQGQIWVADEDNTVTYFTSIQTIPMEIGEPIHYFPLGSQHLNPSIEIMVTVNPFSEGGVPPRTRANQENGR